MGFGYVGVVRWWRAGHTCAMAENLRTGTGEDVAAEHLKHTVTRTHAGAGTLSHTHALTHTVSHTQTRARSRDVAQRSDRKELTIQTRTHILEESEKNYDDECGDEKRSGTRYARNDGTIPSVRLRRFFGGNQDTGGGGGSNGGDARARAERRVERTRKTKNRSTRTQAVARTARRRTPERSRKPSVRACVRERVFGGRWASALACV